MSAQSDDIQQAAVISIAAGIAIGTYALTSFLYFLQDILPWGFFEAWWRGDEFAVNEEEGKFIRQFRRSRMLGKLGGKAPSTTTLSKQLD